MKRDKQNASSMNYRMTTTDSIGGNPFLQSVHMAHNPSSNSSSPSTNNNPFRSSFFQDSTNKECKNIRNYHHLYEL